ncbi:NAD-dependent epimerase/dehydratase family protein [Faecalibaculum rodentium]|uniref:NAD-dependent epimerase/dehydratase family protein n=3 Tax=Faecalibaculum rodentium TaxID=1702221 RepID=UPI0023F0832D|nr:NAD-dependent epimerase/dehydratase family protein [Faecalibaculum rodentium]
MCGTVDLFSHPCSDCAAHWLMVAAGRIWKQAAGRNEVSTKKICIITGAAGFLGNNIVRELQNRPDVELRCLLLPGTSLESLQGLRYSLYYGSVTEPESLKEIFSIPSGALLYVIHCAGIVDRKPGYDPKVCAVNVQGTEIVARKTLEAGGRLIYISSVQAMPPGKGRQPMQPATVFDPDTVIGLYSKAKAEASRRVQALMKQGLDAVIIQPSGLIGPNDYDHTNMSEFFCKAASGKLPACVKAGYSFVDVRDAAQMIVAACTRGVSGQSYLAAGPTVSMMKLAVMAARISHTRPVALELPLDVVLAVTPVTALCYRLSGKKPLFTAFAVQTLESDSNFDVSKSVEDLGFSCRPLKETVTDIIRFQQGIFRLAADAILTPQGPVRAKNGKLVWTKTALAAAAVPAAAWLMAGRRRKSGRSRR